MKGVKGSTLPLSEDEAIRRINIVIDKKNKRPNVSLSFVGFAEKWHGATTKLILHCNIHDITWNTTCYNNFITKDNFVGCVKCKGDTTRRTHTLTSKEAYDRLVKKYQDADIDTLDFTPVLDTYTKFINPVTVICKKHGTVISYPYNVFYEQVHSNHCPDCYNEFRWTSRAPEETSLLERIDKKVVLLSERGYDIEFRGFVLDKDEYHPTMNSKLSLYCNIHNITWEASSVTNFVGSNGPSCPQCSRHSKRSSGEKYCYSEVLKYVDISKVFSDKVISFKDFRFYNISNILLPDIYIENFNEQNIIIEYDGEQHYRFIEHVHRDETRYIRQVRRDQFLQIYCKENNIRLLRIPWKDEKRIPEIIRSFLVEGIDITTKVYPKVPPVVLI